EYLLTVFEEGGHESTGEDLLFLRDRTLLLPFPSLSPHPAPPPLLLRGPSSWIVFRPSGERFLRSYPGDPALVASQAKGKSEKSMVADNESGKSAMSEVRTSTGMFLAKRQVSQINMIHYSTWGLVEL
ncbi:unnamed protein product, partial [Musa acuminata var. zebrina]